MKDIYDIYGMVIRKHSAVEKVKKLLNQFKVLKMPRSKNLRKKFQFVWRHFGLIMKRNVVAV